MRGGVCVRGDAEAGEGRKVEVVGEEKAVKYDYLIVGAGLFGSVFAHEMKKAGKNVVVIDKRGHIGGNVYTENVGGINVHKYGAHIFHTNRKSIWEYVQQFAEFNRYTNSPIARYKDELYNLPFNMNTFNKMWGVTSPSEAARIISEQRAKIKETPQNLEEQAISLVGTDIYEKLVKGYTEKQWGRDCKELPAFIIKRLPVRMIYDNNYFNDRFQGIPIGGYTKMIEKMLEGIEVKLNTDFLAERKSLCEIANKVVYTGAIDGYFDYSFGELEYRSLRFETEDLPMNNYQGNAVVNYTEYEIPYTRIIEHKHFEYDSPCDDGNTHTVITREYPVAWKQGDEPYYPINDEKNNKLFEEYRRLGEKEKNVLFGGRLGEYKYYDMDRVIEAALAAVGREIDIR